MGTPNKIVQPQDRDVAFDANLTQLYHAANNPAMGSLDDFKKAMQIPENAKQFYNAYNPKLNFGDEETFYRNIGLEGALTDKQKQAIIDDQLKKKDATPLSQNGQNSSGNGSTNPSVTPETPETPGNLVTANPTEQPNIPAGFPVPSQPSELTKQVAANTQAAIAKGKAQVEANEAANTDTALQAELNQSILGEGSEPLPISPTALVYQAGKQVVSGLKQLNDMYDRSGEGANTLVERGAGIINGAAQLGFGAASLVNPSLLGFNAVIQGGTQGVNLATQFADMNGTGYNPVTGQALSLVPKGIQLAQEWPKEGLQFVFGKNPTTEQLGDAGNTIWQMFLFKKGEQLLKGNHTATDMADELSNNKFDEFAKTITPEEFKDFTENVTPEEIQRVAEQLDNIRNNTVQSHPAIQDIQNKINKVKSDYDNSLQDINNPDLPPEVKAIANDKLQELAVQHKDLTDQLQSTTEGLQQNVQDHVALTDQINGLKATNAKLEEALPKTADKESVQKVIDNNQAQIDQLQSQADELQQKINPASGSTPEVQPEIPPKEATASIPLMITKDMRQQLYDLGHTKAEVDQMTPQQANDILQQPLNTEQNAVPQSKAGEILQRQSSETGISGSERGGVEPSQQGNEVTGESVNGAQNQEVGELQGSPQGEEKPQEVVEHPDVQKQRINDLIDDNREYQNQKPQQKNSKEGRSRLRGLNQRASDLGFVIRDGKLQDENGKPVGKKRLSKPTIEQSQPYQKLSDFDTPFQKYVEKILPHIGEKYNPYEPNIDIPSEVRDKGIKDIKEGIASKEAQGVLDALKRPYDEGQVPIKAGSGFNLERWHIPIEEFESRIDHIHPEESKPLTDAEERALFKEHGLKDKDFEDYEKAVKESRIAESKRTGEANPGEEVQSANDNARGAGENSAGEGIQTEQQSQLNKQNNEQDLGKQPGGQPTGQENGGGQPRGQESGQNGSEPVKQGEEAKSQPTPEKGGQLSASEKGKEDAKKLILEGKAELEAIRNRKKLEAQTNPKPHTMGAAFEFDPDEIKAYKKIIQGYINLGINTAAGIIQKLREDFGDFLKNDDGSDISDKDIREQLLNGKETKVSETSTKNEYSDPTGKYKGSSKSMSQMDVESKKYHESIVDWKQKAKDDAESKANISEIEEGAYLHEMTKTQNELNGLNKKINEAIDKGDTKEEMRLTEAREDLEDHMENLRKVEREAGAKWGRWGVLRQRVMANDYSYDAVKERAKTFIRPDKEGKRIIPKSIDDVLRASSEKIGNLSENLSKETEDARKRFDNFNKVNDEINKQKAKIAELEKEIKDLKAGRKPSIRDSGFGEKNKIFTKERFEMARKSLQGKAFSSLAPPPELFEMAGYVIEGGIHEFADFSKEMIGAIGEKVKPYLKELYTKSVDNLQKRGLDINPTPENEIDNKEAMKLRQREKAIITRKQNQLENLKKNIPPKPRLKPLDTPAIRELNKQIGAEKLRIDSQNKILAYKNKTFMGKVLAWALKVRRGVALSDLLTVEKIGAFVADRMGGKALDDAADWVFRTIFSKIQEGSGLSKPTIDSFLTAYTEGFSKATFKQAWRKFWTGANSLDEQYGNTRDNYLGDTGGNLPEKALNTGGRTHGMVKTPEQYSAYAEATKRMLKYAVDHGEEVTPELMEQIGAKADAWSLDAIGMTRNRVGGAINRLIGRNPVAQYLYNTINLFKNVPLNLAEKYYIRSGAGFFHGLIQILGHSDVGNRLFRSSKWSELTPETRNQIFEYMSKGWIGGLVTIYGAVASAMHSTVNNTGGLYQKNGTHPDKTGLKPGEIMLFGHKLSPLQARAFESTPFGLGFAIGGTLTHNFDSDFADNKGAGLWGATKSIGGAFVAKVPYLDETLRISNAFENSDKLAVWAGDFLAGYFDPQMLKRIAAYYDTGKNKPSWTEIPQSMVTENSKMITINRKPTTVKQEIEKGIPGLREKTPVNQKYPYNYPEKKSDK